MTTQAVPEFHAPLAAGGRIDVRHDDGGTWLEVTTTHGASRATTRVWLSDAEVSLLAAVLRG